MGEIPRVHQVDPTPRTGGQIQKVADASDRARGGREETKREPEEDQVDLTNAEEPALIVLPQPPVEHDTGENLDISA